LRYWNCSGSLHNPNQPGLSEEEMWPAYDSHEQKSGLGIAPQDAPKGEGIYDYASTVLNSQ